MPRLPCPISVLVGTSIAAAVVASNNGVVAENSFDPVASVTRMVTAFCDGDLDTACGMLEGEWSFPSMMPPFGVSSINASGCLEVGRAILSPENDGFCRVHINDAQSHQLGDTMAFVDLVWQQGLTPNATTPQCTYGINSGIYAEIDPNTGNLTVMREFFDADEMAGAFAYCGAEEGVKGGAAAGHPATARYVANAVMNPAGEQHAAANRPSMETVSIDDSNASSLCFGMLRQYSLRRCDHLKDYVSADFRFHFSGGPDEGVDIDFFTHNCDAPNPPEWIEVLEWFAENETSGYWWDRYVNSCLGPPAVVRSSHTTILWCVFCNCQQLCHSVHQPHHRQTLRHGSTGDLSLCRSCNSRWLAYFAR